MFFSYTWLLHPVTLLLLPHVDVEGFPREDLHGSLHRIHQLAILEVPERWATNGHLLGFLVGLFVVFFWSSSLFWGSCFAFRLLPDLPIFCQFGHFLLTSPDPKHLRSASPPAASCPWNGAVGSLNGVYETSLRWKVLRLSYTIQAIFRASQGLTHKQHTKHTKHVCFLA